MKTLLLLTLSLFVLCSCATRSDHSFVYFGTYTKKTSKGIYVSSFNSKTGILSEPTLAAEIKNPSFVAVHKNKKYLFSVVESTDDEAMVCSFAIASDGRLTKLSEQPAKGNHPCHVSIDKKGETLFIANYNGANCASFPIGADGKIGPGNYYKHTGSSVGPRQTAPHPHSISVDNKNRFVHVADLGTDKIIAYKLDSKNSKMSPYALISLPAGGGPGAQGTDRTRRGAIVRGGCAGAGAPPSTPSHAD